MNNISRYLSDVCIDRFCKEFIGGEDIKFKNNTVPEGFGMIADRIDAENQQFDHVSKYEELLSGLNMTGRMWGKRVNYRGETISKKEIVARILNEWWKMFMRKIDSILIQKISEQIIVASDKRQAIKETVFNFTSEKIPEQIMRGLSLGSNFVTHTKMSEQDAKNKYEQELLSFLMHYRRTIERKPPIADRNLASWLEKSCMSSEQEHQHFYTTIGSYLDIDIGIGKRVNVDMKLDFKELDQKGICVVEADKGMGICLLNVKELIIADNKMVLELGGQRCDGKSENDIKEELKAKIEGFEKTLDVNARKFLNVYYRERKDEFDKSVLPFLKLRPKLHKLTKDELKMRDTRKLKYRPVVDASRTPINPYAQALMDYLRELIRRAEAKYFDGEKTMAKNGQEIVKFLDKIGKPSTRGKYFAVADLSSAYTFIFLKNLLVAMNYLGKELGIPDWKMTLFEEIAKLVFENSFLETTEGIFLLNTCLPMGLCVSGESMDVVLLLAELVFLGKINSKEIDGFEEQYKEKAKQENKEVSFIGYKRYRDDTFSVFQHNPKETSRTGLEVLGKAFLPSLDLNIDVSYFVGSFLDVVFFKRFSGYGFETTIRRKGCYPIGYCHGSSNMSSSVSRSIISGEILRHRRLTSSRKLQTVNDECLIKELESRGYDKQFLRRAVHQRIKQIGHDYSFTYERREMRKVPEGLVYGSKTVYDQEWFTHQKLHHILKQSLPEGIRLELKLNFHRNIFFFSRCPMVVPGMRLAKLIYTKRRYFGMVNKTKL